ncbi:MAG: DUF3343 domain-containing protein [Clostridia bacterium]|nr:DUF3343 domain-containing protein [Clostridia bacterium]
MMVSITSAMKAREVLQKNGIRSEIVRTPKRLAKAGCGYSLFVPNNFSKAVAVIRNSGIKTVGIAGGEDGL